MLFIGYATIDRPSFNQVVNFIAKKGVPRPVIQLLQRAVKENKVFTAYLLTSGVIISVVSFLGCCGACCSRNLLRLYRYVLYLVVIIIYLAAYLADEQAKNATPLLTKYLSRLFYNYDKKPARVATAITQNMGKCCGVISPKDWLEDEAFYPNFEKQVLRNASHISGNAPVPDSCCTTPRNGCGLKHNRTESNTEQMFDFINQFHDDEQLQEYMDYMEYHVQKWQGEDDQFDYYDYYDDGQKPYDQPPCHKPPATECHPKDKYCKFYQYEGEINWDDHADDYYEDQYDPYAGYDEYDYQAYQAQKEEYKAEASVTVHVKTTAGRNSAGRSETKVKPFIWRNGCAMKFGRQIKNSRQKLLAVFVVISLPVFICLIMACQVDKYFESKEKR